jgi:hypothetical protein
MVRFVKVRDRILRMDKAVAKDGGGQKKDDEHDSY